MLHENCGCWTKITFIFVHVEFFDQKSFDVICQWIFSSDWICRVKIVVWLMLYKRRKMFFFLRSTRFLNNVLGLNKNKNRRRKIYWNIGFCQFEKQTNSKQRPMSIFFFEKLSKYLKKNIDLYRKNRYVKIFRSIRIRIQLLMFEKMIFSYWTDWSLKNGEVVKVFSDLSYGIFIPTTFRSVLLFGF